MFLYIDPLKQGLKHKLAIPLLQLFFVFIHRSIKTRIETEIQQDSLMKPKKVFIHRSIKTRIETRKQNTEIIK